MQSCIYDRRSKNLILISPARGFSATWPARPGRDAGRTGSAHATVKGGSEGRGAGTAANLAGLDAPPSGLRVRPRSPPALGFRHAELDFRLTRVSVKQRL
jgi:hypothetical protein